MKKLITTLAIFACAHAGAQSAEQPANLPKDLNPLQANAYLACEKLKQHDWGSTSLHYKDACRWLTGEIAWKTSEFCKKSPASCKDGKIIKNEDVLPAVFKK